jgi:hypothetical protein
MPPPWIPTSQVRALHEYFVTVVFVLSPPRLPVFRISVVAACGLVLQAFEQIKATPSDSLAAGNAGAATRFLQSKRLLHLQLRDPEFRMHIILQVHTSVFQVNARAPLMFI